MYPVHKRTVSEPKIALCYVFEYISFSASPAPNRYDYMQFSVRLWLFYG